MTAAVPPPLRIGDLIAGQFELRAVIGRGATATVYRAWDRMRSVEVALKVASYEPDGDGSRLAERWRHEAALLERLATPQIVRFYGLHFDPSSRSLALALDYIDGQSLATYLTDSGPLACWEAIRIALAVARGLAYAHRWIVHRDVKPANILLAQDGQVYLTDFGVAKEVIAGETGSTISWHQPLYGPGAAAGPGSGWPS